MPTTTLEQHQLKTPLSKLRLNELYRLFLMSSELADSLEDILEEKSKYSRQFIQRLEKSLEQARQGKAQKINSLKELK